MSLVATSKVVNTPDYAEKVADIVMSKISELSNEEIGDLVANLARVKLEPAYYDKVVELIITELEVR